MRDPVFHRQFKYDKSLLPNAYLASLEEGVKSLEEAKLKTGYTIGYPGWGVLYHMMLSHLNPDRHEIIVETGTNWGCTTIILAQAIRDLGGSGKVVTIELDPDNLARAKANIEAAGLTDLVDFYEADSRELLPAMNFEEKSIRFAFLDASHLMGDVLAEFDAINASLSDDALVVFDNTYQIADPDEDQRVNGALKGFQKTYGGNLINLEYVSWFTPGLAFWQKQPKL